MTDDEQDADGAVLSCWMPEALSEKIDEVADGAGLSRSTLGRRLVEFGLEAQGEEIVEAAELRDEEREIIERNQEVRELLPSHWRSHVRDLFGNDLRNDLDPADLRTMAAGYREQAEVKEQRAEKLPMAPEADLVGIVDEELAHALEAADLSNWYSGVENPHERHLTGVEDGKREREDVVALVAGVVETYQSLAAAFSDPNQCPAVEADDLPRMADSLLPADVSREDVAEVSTALVRAGVTADEVPDVLPTVDPALEPEEIPALAEADGGPDLELTNGADHDVEQATVRMGGQPVEWTDDADDEQDEQPDADDGQPLAVAASETTQEELTQMLAAADGGRSPDAVPGHRDTSMEVDMNPTTTDGSIDDDRADDLEGRADE